MATVTGPVADTRDAQLPDALTWAVAIATADAGAVVLPTIDLRFFDRLEVQFVGTLTAGTIGFRGGIDPSGMYLDNVRFVNYQNSTATTSINLASAVLGACREMSETNLPPYLHVVVAATFAGSGTLYLRASRGPVGV